MSALEIRLLSLRGLKSGPGRDAAVRVWIALWSHARWGPGQNREVWCGPSTLARLACVDVRATHRALALLVRSGLIERGWGRRGKLRTLGRVTTLAPDVSGSGPNPCFSLPPHGTLAQARRIIAGHTARPGPVLSLALAIFALSTLAPPGARAARGGASLNVPLAVLIEVTGTSRSRTFYRRLVILERAGLISRDGERWCDGVRAHMPAPEHAGLDRQFERPIEGAA